MTLENLARIGRLRQHQATAAEVAKLIAAAERNLADACNGSSSAGTRYTCAYTAVMQAAQAALFVHGFRPETNSGGHHATLIQALVHTIGLPPARMQVLDVLRRKRNLIDYLGEEPEPSEVEQSIAEATALLGDVRVWLTHHRPDLA